MSTRTKVSDTDKIKNMSDDELQSVLDIIMLFKNLFEDFESSKDLFLSKESMKNLLSLKKESTDLESFILEEIERRHLLS
jgi:hypothetical protein